MLSSALIDQEKEFESFGLDDRILKAVRKLGWNRPTIVQSASIPLSLKGKDILAKARTGSGKTAAYSLPIIHKLLFNLFMYSINIIYELKWLFLFQIWIIL